MGTTLTGTTPQDTYDSLIKVTDNGPLSGTAKYLSDGLGNDSKLALSTGNIGIGTAAPSFRLDISGSGRFTDGLTVTGSLIMSPTSSFVFPLSQSVSPLTGSAYWSGSFLFVYDGTQYRSSSFA